MGRINTTYTYVLISCSLGRLDVDVNKRGGLGYLPVDTSSYDIGWLLGNINVDVANGTVGVA